MLLSTATAATTRALRRSLALLALLGGCGDEPQEQHAGLRAGSYTLDTLSFETNTCGIDGPPLADILIEIDPADPERLRFPDFTIGGQPIPTASAVLVDGTFNVTFSGVISQTLTGTGGDSTDCILTIRLDLEASVLDNNSWSIDAGKHTLEAVIGPAETCGADIQVDMPGYDPVEGCSRTFTATMKRNL